MDVSVEGTSPDEILDEGGGDKLAERSRMSRASSSRHASGRLRLSNRQRDSERRRTELRRADRQRDERHPQDTRWVELLESLVDGYKAHISVRCGSHRELLPPTWTDLFLWAVLTGRSDGMVHTLWQRTRFPLRSAVMASQLCITLAKRSTDEHLEEELKDSANRYEQWAVYLLETSSRAQAMGMLALVPTKSGLPLYPTSVLDAAASDQGSTPCKRVVSHRYAQELIESFFVGDYPGSPVRIGFNASYSAIVLQIFLPFLPGVSSPLGLKRTHAKKTLLNRIPFPLVRVLMLAQVFCELMPSHFLREEPLRGPGAANVSEGKAAAPMTSIVQERGNSSSSPQPWRASRIRVSHSEPTGKGGGGARDAVLPPDEFRLNDAADFLPASESDAALGALWGGNNKLAGAAVMDDANSFLRDMWDDARSGRAFAFYSIPKVRFTFITLLYLGYMIEPIFFLIYEDLDGRTAASSTWPSPRAASIQGMPPTVGYVESFFWVWSLGRFLQELGSVDVSTGLLSGLQAHFHDVWNCVDFFTYSLLFVAVALRLSNSCGMLALAASWDSPEMHSALHEMMARADCQQQQLYARSVYAIIVTLIWTRLVQLTRVFKDVGQMSIVLGRMMVDDVSIFFQLVLIISPGFGIAFAALQPPTFPASPPGWLSNMDSPFWTPVWGLLGDADRERMLEATSGVEPSRTVLQVLLWLYMFLTTVVLVNLLIAQMSQTYERGMEQGKEDWCFRRAALIIEFKDTLRGTLPPPFNLVHLPARLLLRLTQKLLGAAKRSDDRASGMSTSSLPSGRGFRLIPAQAVQDTLLRGEYEALCRCVEAQQEAHEGELSTILGSLQARLDQVEASSENRSERLNAQLQGLLSARSASSVAAGSRHLAQVERLDAEVPRQEPPLTAGAERNYILPPLNRTDP